MAREKRLYRIDLERVRVDTARVEVRADSFIDAERRALAQAARNQVPWREDEQPEHNVVRIGLR